MWVGKWVGYFRVGCLQLVDLNGGRDRTRTCDLLRVKQAQAESNIENKEVIQRLVSEFRRLRQVLTLS